MNLAAALQFLEEELTGECSENIAFRCAASKRLEDAGNYVGASLVLGNRWRGAGSRPALGGLEKNEAALLLLRSGMLSHRIAVTEARAGAQDEAKELLDEAARMYAALGDVSREGEALVGVALCYWRQTALEEARLVLKGVLKHAATVGVEVIAAAKVALASVEWTAGEDERSLRLLLECRQLVEQHGSHRLLAGFHCTMALVRRRAGDLDAALIEDAAASYHLEKAGDIRQCARIENNVGYIHTVARRFAEAHEHYGRAYELFTKLGDEVYAAGVNESRAQALLAEKRPAEAEGFAHRAVEALNGCDEKGIFVEALLTLGRALARQGKGPAAWEAFERAGEVAHNFISSAAADNVTDVMLDELGPVLFDSLGGNYFDAYKRLQRALIKRALVESDWVIRRAAFKLGLKEWGLNQLLRKTHKDVWDEKPFN
jgi:tetratricopeptide (TPR) repeat protein